MKMKTHLPATVAPPASNYAHGMSVDGAERWVHVSGQVGITPDGSLSADIGEQMVQTFRNIASVLADADMSMSNLVKLTVFLTDTANVGAYRVARDEALDGHCCASTLLVVSALASPDWLVEIEAIAAA